MEKLNILCIIIRYKSHNKQFKLYNLSSESKLKSKLMLNYSMLTPSQLQKRPYKTPMWGMTLTKVLFIIICFTEKSYNFQFASIVPANRLNGMLISHFGGKNRL